MKFNLSASVKLVAQRLNPDLTIPDRDTKPSPPSSSASASASAPTSHNGRKSPSHSSLSLSTRNNSHKKGKNASPPSLSLLVPTNNTTTITCTGAKLSKSNSDRRDKGKNPASSSSSSSSNTNTTPPSPEIVLTPPPSHHRDFAKARDSITRTEAPEPSPISAASFPAPGKSTWKTVNRPTTPLLFSSPGVDNSGPTTTATTTTSTYKSTLDPGSVNSRTGGFGTLTGPSIPQAAVEMAANTSTRTLSTAAAAATTTTTTNATASSVRAADKSLPYFPRAGLATDGYTTSTEATATCFCGAVQLSFPTEAPGLVGTFVCNCTDCRKITASMFASNFTVRDEYLHHLRGKQNLKAFSQSETVASGHAMTNHFCCICGSLMYRVGAAFPGCSILRLGTVDDFSLVETKLRPMREVFVKDRVGWLGGVLGEDVKRSEGMP